MSGGGVPSMTLFNVGTSLDLDALAQVAKQSQTHSDLDSDDADEEEVQQRNAELQNMLTNAFDDLIEDESDLESTVDRTRNSEAMGSILTGQSGDDGNLKFLGTEDKFQQDSLYSPLHENQDSSAAQLSLNNNSLLKSTHKNTRVRFGPLFEESGSQSYQPTWRAKLEETEREYLSSGLNSRSELDILYAARGSEITKLEIQLHQLQHKLAMLEGEKTGLSMTLQNSEQALRDCHDENACLKDEVTSLNERLLKMTDTNCDLTAKMDAAENKIISLERQILDINTLQASKRDANRQEVIFSGIKSRYENDLQVLRDNVSHLRSELEAKDRSLTTCERKLREVTEMHERTLVERAGNLQEFNRALDQQRQLREQRDSLTSSALLEQLSQTKEELDRLKSERISQALTDSLVQLRITDKEQDLKQTEHLVKSLEQRMEEANQRVRQSEETITRLQLDNQIQADRIATLSDSCHQSACQREKLATEVENVKELYLKVCLEKDTLEEQLRQRAFQLAEMENERKVMAREMEQGHRQAEEAIRHQRTTLESNIEVRLETAVREGVARARLEWIKEKSSETTSQDQVHVEKSLSELQCLRETMDALRMERDHLQAEAAKLQQQVKTERQLLQEKFKIEKKEVTQAYEDKLVASLAETDEVRRQLQTEKEELVKSWQVKTEALQDQLRYSHKEEMWHAEKEALNKSWQDRVAVLQQRIIALQRQVEEHESNDELIKATADAMNRLRLQCDEEKLHIIRSYEKQICELQTTASVSTSAQPQPTDAHSDWRSDVAGIRMALRNSTTTSEPLLRLLDTAVKKIEVSLEHAATLGQRHADKYRQLKRRVREYQKYAMDKLAKEKEERLRSEQHCRCVIMDLLERVSRELRQCQNEQPNSDRTPTVAIGSSNLAQTIDELQSQVNLYLLGVAGFDSKRMST